jgi:DNA processing protein
VTGALSANTQAILMLTAPLAPGRAGASADLLSPAAYGHLARQLRALGREPADLLDGMPSGLEASLQPGLDAARLDRLLGRGFQLGQAVQRWQSRALWVLSRADPGYPRRLKQRLRDEAPAVLYGCGRAAMLDAGGLAIAAAPGLDAETTGWLEEVARLCARAGRGVVADGADGGGAACLQAAIDAGGTALGVLAGGLERAALQRGLRDALIDGRLALVSVDDPAADPRACDLDGRDTLMACLADALLTVSADIRALEAAAGTGLRAGVPVFRRAGPDASRQDAPGASPWPDPIDEAALDALLGARPPG